MISMLFTFAAGCGGGNTSEKELPYKPLIKPDLIGIQTRFFRAP